MYFIHNSSDDVIRETELSAAAARERITTDSLVDSGVRLTTAIEHFIFDSQKKKPL